MKKYGKKIFVMTTIFLMAAVCGCNSTPDVKGEMVDTWPLLSKYEDKTIYRVGENSFAREESEEFNTYIVELEAQIAKPEEICFSFSKDVEHGLLSISSESKILSYETVGKGEHTLKVDENAAIVAFFVHDEDEKDFVLMGNGDLELTKNNLYPKSFSVLGDSLSTYYGYIPKENRNFYDASNFSVRSMWWQTMAGTVGMEPLIINAFGGAGVTNLHNDQSEGNGERSENLHRGEKMPDMVFVLLGANDMAFGVSVKQLEEEYLEMVMRIQKSYPKAEICLCTYFPIPALGDAVEVLNEVIGSVAKKANVQLLDTAKCDMDGIGFLDTVHIDAKGQEEFGKYAANLLLEVYSNKIEK